MKCEKCGNKINDNDKFCINCGEKVNNLICPNCGQKRNGNENFCTKCGTKLSNNTSINNQFIEEKQIINGINNDVFYCLLSLAICYLFPTLLFFINKLTGISISGLNGYAPLISFGLCIYARVKYPNSTFAKVLLIIYIVQIIIAIITVIILFATCLETLSNCPGMIVIPNLW